jgi:thymidylate kinase
MIIAISGTDGSGKTTIAKSLTSLLAQKGYKTIYHEEFRYTFLGSVLKWIYGDRLDDARDSYLGRRGRRGLVYKLWPYFLYVDCWVSYVKYGFLHRDKIVIFDRYFYDFIIAFDGLGDLNALIYRLYLALPKPYIGVLLSVPPEVSYERRKDEYPPKPFEWFVSWHERYINLNKRIKFLLVNSNRTVEETLDTLARELRPILEKTEGILGRNRNVG